MVLGESNDVLYSVIILLNECYSLNTYNHMITLLLECLHNGVRLRPCFSLKHYCLSLKYNSSSVLVNIDQFVNFKRKVNNLNNFLCKLGLNLVTVSTN